MASFFKQRLVTKIQERITDIVDEIFKEDIVLEEIPIVPILKSNNTKGSCRLRGLHLDPARRILTPQIICQIIKRSAQSHINTLHLHLTDDQGIAVNLETLGFDKGWTIDEQLLIVDTCKKYNLDIITEIDIPGHTVALRSLLETGVYKPEIKMGVISEGLISLNHLPKILQVYDEIFERFQPKYFHMGGDETKGASKHFFQTLVNEVCNWGKKKNLSIIAWEDVLTKIDDIPENLIIHKWKHRTFPPVIQKLEMLPKERQIYSVGYYLDTCIDVFTVYRKKIDTSLLGYIACTWGELIGEENIEHTIFPTLYLLGHRWLNSTVLAPPIPLLISLCDEIGWIKSGNQKTWKRRQWASFVKDATQQIPPRSASSVTSQDALIRPEDEYPLISNCLIRIAESIYKQGSSALSEYVKIFAEAGANVTNITNLRVVQRLMEKEEQVLYKNGLRMVIRECLRK